MFHPLLQLVLHLEITVVMGLGGGCVCVLHDYKFIKNDLCLQN